MLENIDVVSLAGWAVAVLLVLAYLVNKSVISLARSLVKQGAEKVDALLYVAENADPLDIAKMVKKQKSIQQLEENKIAVDPTIKAEQNELLKDAVGKKFS